MQQQALHENLLIMLGGVAFSALLAVRLGARQPVHRQADQCGQRRGAGPQSSTREFRRGRGIARPVRRLQRDGRKLAKSSRTSKTPSPRLPNDSTPPNAAIAGTKNRKLEICSRRFIQSVHRLNGSLSFCDLPAHRQHTDAVGTALRHGHRSAKRFCGVTASGGAILGTANGDLGFARRRRKHLMAE